MADVTTLGGRPMTISDVLEVMDSAVLPPHVRRIAQALYIAMLALDRYGHMMSYEIDEGNGSEVDHDKGFVARRALEEIRELERRVH
jgi:hypothetical protein